MKNLLSCCLILFVTYVYAQSPQSFKYQAVLRDNGGLPLIEKNITIKISILQGSLTGLSAYSEVHQAKTSPVGVVNLEIGKGTQNVGNFTTISWGTNSHFVKIEIDPLGGSNFEQVGTSQLLSVPYALYAEKSGDEKWGKVNSDISYLGGNVGIGTSNPSVKLDVEGVNPAIQLNKAELRSTESEGKGRIDLKGDQIDLGNAYLTSLNRVGDFSEDLIFGLQQPIGNSTSWNILESWRGAGLMVSSSGTEQRPLLFGIDRIEKMRIDGNGNVGIGITNPVYQLDVGGSINATNYLINGQQFSGSPWSSNGGNIYITTSNVGIGTSNPQVKLDIEGINSSIQLHKAELKSTESEGKGRIDLKGDQIDLCNAYLTSLNRIGDSSDDLIFGLQQPIGNSTSWNILESWRGAGLMLSSSGTEQRPLLFGIDRIEKMRIDGNGNVGIGTINPKSKLQVESGDVYINSINSGLIMKSPNGQCWRMSIDNSGNPVFSPIICP
ncbi:MAG: hypothetical protein ABL895_06535 [Cyclobacteriaceae bacterium]